MPTRSPVIAGVDPTKITLPRPALAIEGRTAWATYADPRRSTSSGRRSSAGVRSVNSLFHSSTRNGCPAKQAAMSMRPNVARAFAARLRQEPGSVTSLWIAAAFRPRPCTFSTTDWAASFPRPYCTARLAPSRAKSKATARPSPPLPPVTIATRPSSRPTGTAPAPRVINPRGLAGFPRKTDEMGARARVHGEIDGDAGRSLHRLQGRPAINRHRAVPGWRDDRRLETLVRGMGGTRRGHAVVRSPRVHRMPPRRVARAARRRLEALITEGPMGRARG